MPFSSDESITIDVSHESNIRNSWGPGMQRTFLPLNEEEQRIAGLKFIFEHE